MFFFSKKKQWCGVGATAPILTSFLLHPLLEKPGLVGPGSVEGSVPKSPSILVPGSIRSPFHKPILAGPGAVLRVGAVPGLARAANN